mmetsp:Transcript_20540/g.44958  ORF Transcript_20540/g.44958 Transcript_20540/m.44958 type:complete len:202 (-) Transcript_20540:331-936(-)
MFASQSSARGSPRSTMMSSPCCQAAVRTWRVCMSRCRGQWSGKELPVVTTAADGCGEAPLLTSPCTEVLASLPPTRCFPMPRAGSQLLAQPAAVRACRTPCKVLTQRTLCSCCAWVRQKGSPGHSAACLTWNFTLMGELLGPLRQAPCLQLWWALPRSRLKLPNACCRGWGCCCPQWQLTVRGCSRWCWRCCRSAPRVSAG